MQTEQSATAYTPQLMKSTKSYMGLLELADMSGITLSASSKMSTSITERASIIFSL